MVRTCEPAARLVSCVCSYSSVSFEIVERCAISLLSPLASPLHDLHLYCSCPWTLVKPGMQPCLLLAVSGLRFVRDCLFAPIPCSLYLCFTLGLTPIPVLPSSLSLAPPHPTPGHTQGPPTPIHAGGSTGCANIKHPYPPLRPPAYDAAGGPNEGGCTL